MKVTAGLLLLALVRVIPAQQPQAPQPRSVWDGAYLQEQATAGKAVYDQHCSQCHGADVLKLRTGGAPNLTGPTFKENWNGLAVGDLFEYIKKAMPRNNAGHLSREETAVVVAYIFASNGFPAGQRELPTDPEALRAIRFDAAKP